MRRAAAPALLVLLVAAGCGYGVAAGAARLPAGAQHVYVPPFQNRTTDAEAGAWVAAALRTELARRNAGGGPDAPARVEGVVEEASFGASSPNGATYRLGLVVLARLVVDGKPPVEYRSRREEDWLAGQDPLESEGRRRLALRRAAEAVARDVVERLEQP